MRVLVCGGRNFYAYEAVEKFLDMLHALLRFEVVIHGAQRGADQMAGRWARSRHVDELPFPADWDNLGKPAGYIRNTQMLNDGKPDLVVAFPGGKGTRMMKRIATNKVRIFDLADAECRAMIERQYQALKELNANR